MKNIIGIYKIENLINHKVYIGQSVNVKERFHKHRGDLRNGKHNSKHLQNAWNKYGEKNFSFEIIEECAKEKLDEREIYWIDFYGGFMSPNNYNKRGGGQESHEISEETKEKLRKANLGKKASQEAIEKRSRALKGHPYWAGNIWTKELREKVSLKRKGKLNEALQNYDRNNPEYRANLSNALKGKKKSAEHAKHISEGRKGVVFSEVQKQKISKSKIGNHNIPKGSKKMKKDGIVKWAKPDQIESFKEQGWEEYHEFYAGENFVRIPWNKGIPCSEEQKANLRAKNLGKKLSKETIEKMAASRRGKIWVHNENKNKVIEKEQLEKYLQNGWKKGKIKNASRNI